MVLLISSTVKFGYLWCKPYTGCWTNTFVKLSVWTSLNFPALCLKTPIQAHLKPRSAPPANFSSSRICELTSNTALLRRPDEHNPTTAEKCHRKWKVLQVIYKQITNLWAKTWPSHFSNDQHELPRAVHNGDESKWPGRGGRRRVAVFWGKIFCQPLRNAVLQILTAEMECRIHPEWGCFIFPTRGRDVNLESVFNSWPVGRVENTEH